MDRRDQPVNPTSARRLLTLGLLAAVPLAVLGLFFLLPVGGMLARGLWPEGRFDPGGVLAVLARPRVHRVVWFTLWTSTAGTVLSLAAGLPAAYLLYRVRLPGRRLLRALVLVPFVLPTIVVGVAFRQLLGAGGPLGFLGWDGSPAAIVAGLVFFNAAVVVRAVGTAWESLDPRPEQAAAALGATPAQVLRTVTWPALRPAVVSAASVVFLFCATAFGIVLTLGGVRHATVETEIYLLTTNLLDLRAAAALSLLQLASVVGLLLLAQRLRAVPDPTVARSAARPRSPRRGDLPALLGFVALLGLLVAPLVTLLTGALRTPAGWGLGNFAALASTGEQGPLPVPVTEALLTSLRTAVDATWMSLSLGLLVAAVVTGRSRSRAERRARAAFDALVMLPLGVSAVTVGFGFLITLGRPPLDLRDSPLLVPVAQALVALPWWCARWCPCSRASTTGSVKLPRPWAPRPGGQR
ncbi:MAG: ABC transporter permease subunit [Nocardioides sp.]